ncbi:MAG TPA: type II secretion system ATPase GspE [Acidobacteriota bacterium]|nr:type II secretion system ATPase GspE [Acidobacteriota bacterium]HRV08404.1 type II secretion system ATPase GspE [Acidobacteriota bacterium]
MVRLTDLQKKKPFGEVLVDKGVITPEELATVLNLRRQTHARIGKLLVDLGAVSESDLVRYLSEYLGIPCVRGDELPSVPVLENTFSLQFMKECRFVPIGRKDERTLVIAMADPQDQATLDAIRLYTGFDDLEVCLAPESEILDLVEKFYGNQVSSLGRIVDGIQEGVGDLAEDTEDIEHLKDLASEAPVIRLVNLIITRAVEGRASDIHIEPFERELKVRYRIDGVLYDVESPPKRLKAAVISRIKLMARLNIAERRIPQDGRIAMRVLGRDIDLRVSTLPTMYGESVVMRILDKSNTQIYDLERLGFSPRMLRQVEELIGRPHGIILVTGPTGSGKTTTLYAALSRINLPDKKIITIEDPVEYQIDGINQIHVNPQIGLTFAAGLRSIVRQDPDVIMVGEMRDLETVEIGIRAALTGHLVFSTLHTNDAPSAIARLVDMGAEDYLIASSVLGVLAQRLVRVLCPHCKQPAELDPGYLRDIGFGEWEGAVYESQGCRECGQTGFRGRIGIYELMLMDDDIRRLTISNADATELRRTAVKNGMVTLRKDGFDKVKAGITTLTEVMRVTQDV